MLGDSAVSLRERPLSLLCCRPSPRWNKGLRPSLRISGGSNVEGADAETGASTGGGRAKEPDAPGNSNERDAALEGVGPQPKFKSSSSLHAIWPAVRPSIDANARDPVSMSAGRALPPGECAASLPRSDLSLCCGTKRTQTPPRKSQCLFSGLKALCATYCVMASTEQMRYLSRRLQFFNMGRASHVPRANALVMCNKKSVNMHKVTAKSL